MLQLPRPEHAPLQPAKREPAVWVAISVTFVPYVNALEQVLPQPSPAGLEDTRPEPFPDAAAVRVSGTRPKVAVTDCAWVMGTTQVPVPRQAPLQPLNREPVAGVAVRIAFVP